ncbi:hypothetical protein J6590_047965 [Homalodisca vitripennis]|nr:hypothetical protein J6590_047965 [Homalodisca vitripennis]
MWSPPHFPGRGIQTGVIQGRCSLSSRNCLVTLLVSPHRRLYSLVSYRLSSFKAAAVYRPGTVWSHFLCRLIVVCIVSLVSYRLSSFKAAAVYRPGTVWSHFVASSLYRELQTVIFKAAVYRPGTVWYTSCRLIFVCIVCHHSRPPQSIVRTV